MSTSEPDFRAEPDPGPSDLALMAGQLGIWHLAQLSTDTSLYNAGEYLEIRGELNVDLFTRAIRRVIGAADTYHLRFRSDGERIRQYVDKTGNWTLHTVDVSLAPIPRAAAEEWMRSDMRAPVDLQTGPIFTQALFSVGPEEFYWYQRVHHIGLDGFGSTIVALRVAQVYQSLLAGARG